MTTRRDLFAVLATLALSLGLLAAPLYSSGSQRATFLQINGFHGLIVFVPVAISILGMFSDRLRVLAGFLMLGWVVVGAWTVGLFYIPIALCLLWPARHAQDDDGWSNLR